MSLDDLDREAAALAQNETVRDQAWLWHLPHNRVEAFVLGPAAIRHKEQRAPIRGPHRPQVLGAAVRDRPIRGWRVAGRQVAKPDFRFIQVAVSVPPPLA